MTTTAITSPDLFSAMERNDEWLGFGYIGERRNFLTTDDEECLAEISREERAEVIATVDALILSSRKWTTKQLFTWANSKNGRWFADMVFGNLADVAAGFENAKGQGMLHV